MLHNGAANQLRRYGSSYRWPFVYRLIIVGSIKPVDICVPCPRTHSLLHVLMSITFPPNSAPSCDADVKCIGNPRKLEWTGYNG